MPVGLQEGVDVLFKDGEVMRTGRALAAPEPDLLIRFVKRDQVLAYFFVC